MSRSSHLSQQARQCGAVLAQLPGAGFHPLGGLRHGHLESPVNQRQRHTPSVGCGGDVSGQLAA